MIWLACTTVVCVVALKRMSAHAASRKPLLARALLPGCRLSRRKIYCHMCPTFQISHAESPHNMRVAYQDGVRGFLYYRRKEKEKYCNPPSLPPASLNRDKIDSYSYLE